MNHQRGLVLAAALALVAAACGGGGDDTADDTTATSAAQTTTTASAVVTTAPPATTTTAASGGESTGTTLEVVAAGGAFDTAEIRAVAGQELTVVFTNNDPGSDEPHNIHFRTADGDFFTPLEEAVSTSEVTFTPLTPGEYTFFCDTHLDQMSGLFIVEAP